MSMFEVIEPPKGKVYAVGDIHGCYNLLMTRLDEIGFNFEDDLLIAVGDLIDRGTQNIECIGLLKKPWFKSVRGNHEDLCINGMFDPSFKECHIDNGGFWFYGLSFADQATIATLCAKMPIAIELDYKGKKFGFVHGHVEENDWNDFKSTLDPLNTRKIACAQRAMWCRERLNTDIAEYTHVSNVHAVIMGHTVMLKPFQRDNCYYIDTGAVRYGVMTILDLEKI